MLTRRAFIRRTALATAAASLPLQWLFRRPARAAGFGSLVSDPDGILDLPAGFTYKVLEQAGADMDDGYRLPARPDGMACFPGPAGTLVLMRNHELSPTDVFTGPYKLGQSAAPQAFDAGSQGGVTRLVVDATTLERVSSNLVLVGTNRNCAGGMSPWGWLSCEENTSTGHGYVFVCPIDATSVQEAVAVPGYGRCNHEAACVDPATNIAYLTEDRGDSCLYRFVPDDPGQPFAGTLQALRVVGQDNLATASLADTGLIGQVAWVDIDQPDPPGDTLRSEAQSKGAAEFARGEGIWFAAGKVYICSTSGGPADGGQIFILTPDGDGGTLELLAQSTDRDQLDMPDNITVAPWGDVIVAEDGSGEQFLRGITPQGEIYDLARNAASNGELAGVCCSPDGTAMFVNLQGEGLTVVITGPFPAPLGGDPDAGPSRPDAGGGNGSPDAGPSAGVDAGTGPGADTDEAGGCGCDSADGASAAGTAVLVGAAALVSTRAPHDD